jgi:hypothetical protein
VFFINRGAFTSIVFVEISAKEEKASCDNKKRAYI